MKSRRERRQEARKNGVAFEPQYNGRVVSKEQWEKEIAEEKARQKEIKETGLIK